MTREFAFLRRLVAKMELFCCMILTKSSLVDFVSSVVVNSDTRGFFAGGLKKESIVLFAVGILRYNSL